MSSQNQPKELQQARKDRYVAVRASHQACDAYFANPTPANKGRWEAAMEIAREASDHERDVLSKFAS